MASAFMPARETAGESGTSTPRMLMSSGTGFHNVSHARCRSLEEIVSVGALAHISRNVVSRTRKARSRSLRTVRGTCQHL